MIDQETYLTIFKTITREDVYALFRRAGKNLPDHSCLDRRYVISHWGSCGPLNSKKIIERTTLPTSIKLWLVTRLDITPMDVLLETCFHLLFETRTVNTRSTLNPLPLD